MVASRPDDDEIDILPVLDHNLVIIMGSFLSFVHYALSAQKYFFKSLYA